MDEQKQHRLRNLSIVGLAIAVGLIGGILFTAKMNWTDRSVAENTQFGGLGGIVNEQGESPFVAVAENVKPAVVSISTKGSEAFANPFETFDFGPFRNFFNIPEHSQPQQRQVVHGGTGIIISKDGYILTNNHLVDNTDEIMVKLSDDEEYKAKVIGVDPITDVALIKIEARLKDEQVARLGDSDKIKIGDWAIAIGNPFGLDWTVTVGVISAKGRAGLNIGGGKGPDVQNFIQTDASINFGNSGGPLVNIKGEVVGINTAINAQGQGIGFAIPINMAKEVAEQLRSSGKVSHGYLGMFPADLTASKKEALNLDKDTKGIFVDQVEDDTPAAKGGLEPGDVITEFDGRKISDVNQFRSLVAGKHAGDKVSAKILREGKEKALNFTLGERADVTLANRNKDTGSGAWLGINVASLNSQRARQWNIKEEEGVLVVRIDDKSPASGVLQEGDVIIEIDRKPVKDIDDFKKISEDLKDRKTGILFRFVRSGRKTFDVVKPE
jgi:Do/DeqQ family serine protease